MVPGIPAETTTTKNGAPNMTHFAVWVLTQCAEASERELSELLAPYNENGEWFADGSRWDWWVVGGRFTGMLDGYDLEKDPANIETCNQCAGTGERPGGREQFGDKWYEWCHGCNGCMGTGQSLKFATRWVEHDGDSQPVSRVLAAPPAYPPVAVVTPDGKWHENERTGWWGATIPNENGTEPASADVWTAAVTALLEQHPCATVTVVDCHV
jgi:hypothetical protein